MRSFFFDRRIFSFAQLNLVPVYENGEPFIRVESTDFLEVCVSESRQLRSETWLRLREASENLNRYDSELKLRLLYGYRSLTVQNHWHQEALLRARNLHPGASEEEIIEIAHLSVAVPVVAGHPTGGAVDVTISRLGEELDMCGKYLDFSDEERLHTFYLHTSREQFERRLLLRDVMISAGFAPFNGEWWHFSYGDREWAAVYGHSHAIFEQVEQPK
jgi:D-alanyl-D-alanine dipeptidase